MDLDFVDNRINSFNYNEYHDHNVKILRTKEFMLGELNALIA